MTAYKSSYYHNISTHEAQAAPERLYLSTTDCIVVEFRSPGSHPLFPKGLLAQFISAAPRLIPYRAPSPDWLTLARSKRPNSNF